MEQLMNEDPVAYWLLGYALFTLLVMSHFSQEYDTWPWKFPAELWVICLLWPLAIICGIAVLIGLGVLEAWRRLTTRK